MKNSKLLAALLALTIGAGVAGFAVGCGKTELPPDDSRTEQPSDDGSTDGSTAEKPAPTSITVTNAATVKPGALNITVSVFPEGADDTFTSSLVGSHTLVSLVDNEIAISEDIEDGYEFTVEVTSVKAPSVTTSFTFTADNRPAEGLYIKTLQRTVNAQQNGGTLQLTHSMYPAVNEEDGDVPVAYSIEEANGADSYLGVSVTPDGLISLDTYVDNRITFTVKASATVGGKTYNDSVVMTVQNEIEREISSEAELRAIWAGTDEASVRHLNNFYVLTDNIALTSAWKAIGDDTHSFEGSFNGNGYTISNFNMNAGWNSGFIYRIGEDGVVENLTLESGTGSGEGLTGLFAGPFAGYLLGTIRNCVANVQVISAPNGTGVYQPIATFVGTLDVTGKIVNCISLGQAIVDKSGSDAVQDDTRQSGFIASYMGSALEQNMQNCFALAGSCAYAIGYHTSSAVDPADFFKTAEQLKSADTFAVYDEETGLGFDRSVWRIVDGSFPLLKNDKFIEPVYISATFGGSDISEADEQTVRHGEYAIEALIEGAGGETNAPQAVVVTISTGNGVAEGAFTFADGKLTVDATQAHNGDVCTVTVASEYNPYVKITFRLIYEAKLAVIASLPAEIEYTADGSNSFKLNTTDYITVLNGSEDAQLQFAVEQAVSGVSVAKDGTLTLTSDCDNTATVTVKITVTDGTAEPAEATATIAIKNLVAKEISTAEQFLNLWTGNNEISRIRLHNNYILTANINLGGSAKMIGIQYDGSTEYPTGYGLFGTFDGNGFTVSWTNTLSVGWHGGLFAKVESGGVVKNLALKGAVTGAIAGPIGYLLGTVENCYFDVAVSATSATQHYGNAVAELGAGGVIRNVIAVGEVTGLTTGHSALFGKTLGTSATAKGTVENCFALEGSVMDASATDKANTVETNLALKTEAELKTAATFAGWNENVWYIVDGAIPMLIYAGFEAPTDFNCTITNAQGDEVAYADNGYTVSAGLYTITANVLPLAAPQAWTMTLLDYSGAEGGVVAENGNGFRVTAGAATGDTFRIELVSNVNPAVKITLSFTVNADNVSVAWKTEVPSQIVYSADGVNSIDFADSIDVFNSTDYNISITLTKAEYVAGVSSDGTVVTVGAESDNTAVFQVTVTVTDKVNESNTATTEPTTITIVNEVFKEISTAEQFLNIWTGSNELSRLHMHNNYRLTADLTLGAANTVVIPIGIPAYTDGETDGYGLFGTFDGNGYELYWSGQLTVGWNSGFFTKIESTGVVKNLKLSGAISGVIAGPVGALYGTVENCYFNTPVYTTHASQPSGSAVAFLSGNGVLRNVICVGAMTSANSANPNLSIYGKTNNAVAVTASHCYALEGKVLQAIPLSNNDNITTTDVAVKTEEELKSADTFAENWDTSIWKITDGSYPALIRGCSVNS